MYIYTYIYSGPRCRRRARHARRAVRGVLPARVRGTGRTLKVSRHVLHGQRRAHHTPQIAVLVEARPSHAPAVVGVGHTRLQVTLLVDDPLARAPLLRRAPDALRARLGVL